MTETSALFMGSDEFSEPVLRALLDGGPALLPPVHVRSVVTQPDRPRGRGRRLEPGQVKRLAEERGIAVLQPERLRDREAVEAVRRAAPELIVVASYGQILPRAVLDIPRFGCLNLHPSLLPRYRGPSPITAPILAGDRETGTSLMLMTSKMDAGPVLSQERTEIGEDETAGELRTRLAVLSGMLLMRELPGWLAGEITPLPQDNEAATYTSFLRKEDAVLNWGEPAEMLERRVRAYNPWPVASTAWGDRVLRILASRAVGGMAEPGMVVPRNGAVLVGAGDGLLELLRVQPPGGRQMSGADFLRGYPGLAGARLGMA